MVVPDLHPMHGADRAKHLFHPVAKHQLVVSHITHPQGFPNRLRTCLFTQALVLQGPDQQIPDRITARDSA